MNSLILGTAGHIDHGKTALVRALTGTDTDRLKEEKARGITIELGFAELVVGSDLRFGVVDVPGHEAFVRAMVAGAAGMDVVVLVVAADEGVMPQTREHLAIVELLAVPELVVALSKCDAVEEDWLELVESDVADALAATPWAGAPLVRTSATAMTGLDALREELAAAAARALRAAEEDLARLPLDRVFTIQGTGTVVTGTMWSGSLSTGETVRILPQDLKARVRGLEVHGRAAERAGVGDRTAVALTGEGSDRDVVSRGATLVASDAWAPTWMLTARVRLLPDTAWSLAHNQRIRVHLGTAEVLARVALLEEEALGPGEGGWVQLRLEEPVVARGRDRLVLRSYSPVTTIGGGSVAEACPPKRNRLSAGERDDLAAVLEAGDGACTAAALDLTGWAGAARSSLPVLTGLTPARAEAALTELAARGSVLLTPQRAFGPMVSEEAERLVLDAVSRGQEEESLRSSVPLASVRAAIPSWAHADAADAAIARLVAAGRLETVEGGVRTPGFEVRMSADQERAAEALMEVLGGDGLAAPMLDELPDDLRARPDLKALLRWLEGVDRIRTVADGLWIPTSELRAASGRIREELAGRTGLGPADFREVLPVTRKHLIPLLNYFDGEGTTRRAADGARDVPEA